jgi:voltage-gated potassium channel Kch
MVQDRAGRRPWIVVVYTLVNIASLICLFGKIYLWLGIKDTVEAATGFPLLDAIYFSAVTWTTLGYGDIVPSPAARPVAAIEALAGYVVMSLMIAALIAMVQPD